MALVSEVGMIDTIKRMVVDTLLMEDGAVCDKTNNTARCDMLNLGRQSSTLEEVDRRVTLFEIGEIVRQVLSR